MIRITRMIIVTKERTAILKQGAIRRIWSILVLLRVTRKGNFRITMMLYLVYPKTKLTSIKQIRPHIDDVEGIVTTYLNVS
jgi:hypothetical protein